MCYAIESSYSEFYFNTTKCLEVITVLPKNGNLKDHNPITTIWYLIFCSSYIEDNKCVIISLLLAD